MKRLIINSTLIAAMALAACGGKQNTADSKKAKAEELKKQIANLQTETAKLQDSLLKLEASIGGNVEAGKLVEVTTMKKAAFESYLILEGTADADQSTIATAKVPGTVTKVLVQPGAAVRAGQILAKIDNTAVSQGRMELENRLTFAKTVYDKQKRLWEQGIGTEIQYLTAKNQKDALEKSLATMDAQIDMYNIKAPLSGTVESVDLRVGQIAAPGMPSFRIISLDNIKVTTEVAETYAKKVKAGDAVNIEFPSLQQNVKSKVSFASKYIDPMNRTFKVEVKLPNVPNLKPNMVAKIKLTDYTAQNAISVPTNCVQRTESGEFVMVAKMDGKNGFVAEKRSVVSGKSSDGKTEITSGLNEGDMVITVGFQELNNGQKVSGSWVKGE